MLNIRKISFGLLVVGVGTFQAQKVRAQVGIGTTTPNNHAILELVSNNKGLLMPRLTTAQRDAMSIGASEEGLVIYNSTLDKMQFWNGASWSDIGSGAGIQNQFAVAQTADYWISGNARIGSNLRVDSVIAVSPTDIGTKMLLYDAGASDFATGIASAEYWFTVPNSTAQYRFYAGASPILTLKGTGSLELDNSIINRKIVLYNHVNNEHEFSGFGINSGVMRYQVPATNNSHVFYAAQDGTSSNELMRIQGDGRVGIGTTAPSAPLEVVQTAYGSGTVRFTRNMLTLTNPVLELETQNTGDGGIPLRIKHNGYGDFVNITDEPLGTSVFRIRSSGYVGIGTVSPSSMLSVGSDGFQVNGSGNILSVNGIATNFPNTQGAAGTYLKNDGSGNLSWSAVASGITSITAGTGLSGGTITTSGTIALTNTGVTAGTYGSALLYPIITVDAQGRITSANTGALSSLFPAGISTQTLRHNGSSWVASSNITNDGSKIGIDTPPTSANLTVAGAGSANMTLQSVDATSQGATFNMNGAGTNPNWVADVYGADLRLHPSSATNNNLQIYNDHATGRTGLYVEGNTGIGIAPFTDSQLAINDEVTNTEARIKLLAGTGTGTTATDGLDVFVNATKAGLMHKENGLLVLGTNSLERIAITGTGNVGVGTSSPTAKLEVAGQIKITGGTPSAGAVLTSDASGLATWQTFAGSGWGLTGNAGTNAATNFIGTTDNVPLVFKVNSSPAGRLDPTLANTFFGSSAGGSATGGNNTAIGSSAMASLGTGFQNTAVGVSALASTTSGSNNVAVGITAMGTNSTGMSNSAFGFGALNKNISGGNNTAIGGQALFYTTSGNNVGVGYNVGQTNVTGTSNVLIGYYADVASSGLSNAIAIGANTVAGASNTMVLGAGVKVGVNISVPNASFHLNETASSQSDIRLTSTSTGTTGTDGLALSINNAAANILSYENLPMYFGTNAANRMTITAAGNVGIGITSPSELLEVAGNIEIPAANEYKYASAKTRFYTVSSAAMTKQNETNTFNIVRIPSASAPLYATFTGGSAGSSAYAVAPVNLPNGAVVTSVTATLYDNSPYDASVALCRVDNTTVTEMALCATSGSSTTDQVIVDNTITSPAVSSSVGYMLRYSGDQNAGSLIRFFNVTITYTVTNAD